MRSFFHIIFVTVAVIFFTACQPFREPAFKRIENLRVSKFGFSGSNLAMDLVYNNPNKVGLKLKSAAGEAWIDNNRLGHFVVDTLTLIPANGDFRLPLNLEVDISKILKNSVLAFLSGEVTIKIEGIATIGKGPVFINYPISYEGKQNLNALLK